MTTVSIAAILAAILVWPAGDLHPVGYVYRVFMLFVPIAMSVSTIFVSTLTVTVVAILVGPLGIIIKLLCDYTETTKSKQRLLRDNRRHSEVRVTMATCHNNSDVLIHHYTAVIRLPESRFRFIVKLVSRIFIHRNW